MPTYAPDLEEVGSRVFAAMAEENRVGLKPEWKTIVRLERLRKDAIRQRAQLAQAERWLRAHDGWIGASG